MESFGNSLDVAVAESWGHSTGMPEVELNLIEGISFKVLDFKFLWQSLLPISFVMWCGDLQRNIMSPLNFQQWPPVVVQSAWPVCAVWHVLSGHSLWFYVMPSRQFAMATSCILWPKMLFEKKVGILSLRAKLQMIVRRVYIIHWPNVCFPL